MYTMNTLETLLTLHWCHYIAEYVVIHKTGRPAMFLTVDNDSSINVLINGIGGHDMLDLRDIVIC